MFALPQHLAVPIPEVGAHDNEVALGRSSLKDIGAATLPPKNNEKLKSLLARHKITVQPPATPTATPAVPSVRPGTPAQ